VADLRRKPAELNVCDNCGAFIYLHEDESAQRTESASALAAVQKNFETKRTYTKRSQAKRSQIAASER
jgi:hypothetical protein